MIGYPLDSHVEYDTGGTPIYDRAISSAPMRKLYKKLFSDGVLPNPSTNMQVSAGDGMNVIVYPGFAMCNGCMKLEEAQRTLAIQASSTAYDRIDTVVLRLNDNDSEYFVGDVLDTDKNTSSESAASTTDFNDISFLTVTKAEFYNIYAIS